MSWLCDIVTSVDRFGVGDDVSLIYRTHYCPREATDSYAQEADGRKYYLCLTHAAEMRRSGVTVHGWPVAAREGN